MYLPKHFEQQDLESLTSLLKAYPLGALVTQHEGVLEANHIPFLLEGPLAAGGKLIGDVKASRLTIADGAVFKGNVDMEV